jgi:DNA-directed RNA polymerase subunit N (RpoN/RPB10)
MYPYIVCTCGRSIGDIYDLFKILKLEKYNQEFVENELDIDPNLFAISEHIQVELDDIFEILCIKTDCCRAKLMSQVEFKELY